MVYSYFYYIKYSFFCSGLVKGNLLATIVGGAAFGVSVIFSIILVLVFVYCLKNNNVNSNVNEQRQHKQNRHRKQNHHVKYERNSPHEIRIISENFSRPIQNDELSESTKFAYGKQIPPSPAQRSS